MSELLTKDPHALSFLFEEDLYQIKTGTQLAQVKEASEEKQASSAFDYLGENNRFFLLLLDEPSAKYLPDAQLEVLKKILQAKGLELKDVALLNLSSTPQADFKSLKDFFSCSRICLFGISPNRLSLPALPSNEPAELEGVKILATFSMSELMQTQHKKVAFWNAMKNF